MTWQDRLIEAAYTSPSGVRVTFQYEDVSKSFDKKTTAFDFPDADGTFIQDTGHTGNRYPLRVIFSGDNHDLESDFFEDTLKERGVGILDHPLYGVVDVVPFGSIRRRDDLKTQANQTVIELSFWATINIVYPSAQGDPASNVLGSVDEYNDAAAQTFDDNIDLDSQVEKSTFQNKYNAVLNVTKSGLDSVASTVESVEKQFNAINDSINNGIDVLISRPLTLAFQTMQLIQAPARALTNIQARLDAYKNLTDSIFRGGNASNSNDFRTDDLYASTYVTGSIISVVNNEFLTRPDALIAAEFILNQMNDLIDWRDDNFKQLGVIDTGESFQQLQEAVAITAGFLVEISFDLKQERIITLDRDRTIIDVTAELYGTIDDRLDFFINTNNLSGSEILELPAGREIVYYV